MRKKSVDRGFRWYRTIIGWVYNISNKLFKIHTYIHTYMQEALETKTCTIRFTDRSQQIKAFNHLIHSRASFKGIDENTIIVNEKDCANLQESGIGYQKIA